MVVIIDNKNASHNKLILSKNVEGAGKGIPAFSPPLVYHCIGCIL